MSKRSEFIKDVFYNGKTKTWAEYAETYGFRDDKQANDYYRWFIKSGAVEGIWEPEDISNRRGLEYSDNQLYLGTKNNADFEEIPSPIIEDEPSYSQIMRSREYQEFLAWKHEQEKNRSFIPGDFMLLGCTHVPFHNKRLFEATLRLSSDIKPTGLILAGDFMDINSLSAHDVGKKPIEGVTLDWEYQEGNKALDMLMSSNDFKIKHYLYGNHCFTEDTELLTEKGWINLKDYLSFSENIKFASYNLNSGVIEYDYPIEFTIKKYNGIIHNYKGLKLDIAVTPKHKMLYSSSGKNSKYKFELSENIEKRCVKFKTAASNNQNDYEISDDDIKLAAWIHTDGSVKGKSSYMIYQSKPENIVLIENILDNKELQYTKKIRHRNTKEICGKHLLKTPLPSNEYYINTGQYDLVKNKKVLGDWVYKLSKRQFDIFINELVLGDGSKHVSSPKKSWMLYGEKSFLDQVQILCILNGYNASISKYREKDYRLNINVDTNETKINSINRYSNFSKMKYSGHVWCPTMNNGTVVCRRNGKVSIQGNCDRYLRHMSKVDNAKYGKALLSPTEALKLNERGFIVQESWKEAVVYLGKHLEVFHGESVAQFSTKKTMDAFRTSSVYFHTHRYQTYMEGNTSSWNLGWGGDINSPAFGYATKSMKSSWKNAFGIVHIDDLGGYHITPVIWHNDSFYYGSKKYQ